MGLFKIVTARFIDAPVGGRGLHNLARYIVQACLSQERMIYVPDKESDDVIQAVIPNEMSSREFRQNWARLIQKVYEVDPLLCPKCQGTMKIISFIEDLDIIEKWEGSSLASARPMRTT